MPTRCIHCSMRAILNDGDDFTFEDTSKEHQARVHSDPVATQQELAELETRFVKERYGFNNDICPTAPREPRCKHLSPDGCECDLYAGHPGKHYVELEGAGDDAFRKWEN